MIKTFASCAAAVGLVVTLAACASADRDYRTNVKIENSETGDVDGSIGGGGDIDQTVSPTVSVNLALDPSAFAHVFGAVRSMVPNPSPAELDSLRAFAGQSANPQQQSTILTTVTQCEQAGEQCVLERGI